MILNRFKNAALLFPVLCSLYFSFAFWKTTYLDWKRVRIPLMEQPATLPLNEDTIAFPFEVNAEQRRNLRWLTLNVENNTNRELQFVVFINKNLANSFRIEPNRSARFRTELKENNTLFQRRNFLKVKGSGGGWILKRAEFRNYAASSRGWLDYVIVSKEDSQDRSPSVFLCIVVLVALLSAGLPATTLQKKKRRIHWILLCITFFLFLGLLFVPILSGYKVLVSVPTIFLLLLPAYFPALGWVYRNLWDVPEKVSVRDSVAASMACLLVGLFFYSSMAQSYQQYGDYSGFVQLSKRWTRQNPFLNERPELKKNLKVYDSGYDGQFMYFIAFDPFLQRFSDQTIQYKKWIDHPPFRYGRIGFPLLTMIASSNQPERFPQTMIYLIVISNLIGAFFLARIAIFYKRSPLWALLLICIPAFSVSLRLALPESIAAAFLLSAVFFYLNRRTVPAALCFACSVLVRETAFLGVVLIAAFEYFWVKDRRRAFLLSLSILPFLGWRLFVAWKMFPEYGLQAIPIFSGNMTLPFAGFVRLWMETANGSYAGGSATAALLYPVLLLTALILSILYFRKSKNPLNVALIGFAILAVSLSYPKFWIYMLNGERVTSEVFMFLILAFLGAPESFPKSYRYAFLVFFAFVMFYDLFFLSVAASFRAGFYGAL